MRNIVGFVTQEIGSTSELADPGTIFMFLFIILFTVLILAGVYVYFSFAFMNIGKKLNVKYPAIAWIPFYGPIVIAMLAAKMHWWPFVLSGINLLLYPILAFSMALSPESFAAILVGAIMVLTSVVFMIYATIWLWKMFEALNRPGFYALGLPIGLLLSYLSSALEIIGALFIPDMILRIVLISGALSLFSFLFYLIFAILVGIAAWSKDKEINKRKKKT